MRTYPAPTAPGPVITAGHLRDVLNLGTVLAELADGDVLALGRPLADGERLLATADAVHDFYRRVGSVEDAAAALQAARPAVTSGPLL